MGLQLQHVLAGVGMRRREVDGQPVVDGLALRVPKRQVVRMPGFQGLAQQCLHKTVKAAAGHPHDAHGPPAGSGGDGNDGVVVARQHAGIVVDPP
jgi:hypothetical protein